ncbi:MAG: serine/threonine protein kinase [Eggerthellaceae bacterium]|nr:serine/threonine protein kinase [Eggerthellaceae bacterium]
MARGLDDDFGGRGTYGEGFDGGFDAYGERGGYDGYGEYGDGYGEYDDGYDAGYGDGYEEPYEEPYEEEVPEEEPRGFGRVTAWFGRTFGSGTVKLPDNERGLAQGKGVKPAEVFDRGAGTVPDDVHWLEDLPGLDEARTAAMLSDAHVVAVYDFQVVGNMAYLIMEYVEGMTLTRFLRDFDADLSLDIIAALFKDISAALIAAHTSGVLHLDIKPDNVLIDKRGQAKVTDFGLATLADAQGFGMAGGGTIGYMPPEQMNQESLDARTDEWALASIAYEMLTGKNPFVDARNLDEALDAIDEAELVLPSLCWRGLDAEADDVVFRALDPDREERYDSVAEFAGELQPLLGDEAQGHRELAELVGGAETTLTETVATSSPGVLSGLGAAAAGFVGRAFGGRDLGGEGGAGTRIGAGASAGVGARGTGTMALAPYGSGTGRSAGTLAEQGAAAETAGQGRKTADGRKAAKASGAAKPTATRAGGHFFGIWARVIGFFFSGGVMLLACMNVPLFSTFSEPFIADLLQSIWPAALEIPALQNSFLWALVVACAVLAAIKPSWGALAALLGLGIAITWQGNVWMGLLFIVVTGLWWYCTGRHGGAQANCGLAFITLGAWGFAPLAVLATGIGMRALDAAMTALFGIFACFACASFGSLDILNWGVGANWHSAADTVQMTTNLGLLVSNMGVWIVAGTWLIAAVVGGLCTMPRRRWINIVGTAVAAVCLIAGVCAAAWVTSGHTSAMPETWTLVKTLICCALGIAAACMFVPEPYAKKPRKKVRGNGGGGVEVPPGATIPTYVPPTGEGDWR